MMRSMFSAIAALNLHQLYLDVIANNLSNVNTPGFKGSRVSFQDMFSQTLRGGSAPTGTIGGINPAQIGLGARLGGLDILFTQGSLQATGKNSDLAIQGDGFFIYQGAEANLYSRDGTIDLSADGYLANPNTGLYILGWQADDQGNIDPTQPIGRIRIPTGISQARATANATFQGNLDANTAVGNSFTTTMQIYDSLGGQHTIEITFTRDAAANTWTWTATSSDPAITGITVTGSPIVFTPEGQYDPNNPATSIEITLNNGAVSPQTVNLDFTNLTQLADDSDVSMANQDGMAPGSLIGFNITDKGEVVGLFSNGLNQIIGQLALANFVNPSGLQRVGQNLFIPSANSGTAQIGTAGTSGRGSIAAGYLEMSNVDLAQQFTDMIVAQRGFQANSRVITTSDEMLQDLVNLKR
ncbi:MAG: flagellar hook protein FlgE [Chloroflexota bacterium]